MSNLHQNPHELPRITVVASERDRLLDLGTAALERMPADAEGLLTELDRALIVPADAVPPGLVRMGSAARYRLDDGTERSVTLVFPEDADIASGRVSVLTPIGTALLGLSAGQTIAWRRRDGSVRNLTVVDVGPSHAA